MGKWKYPIGTRIRFINSIDKGLLGEIVGYKYAYYLAFLPKSTWNEIGSRTTSEGVQYTWVCVENDFEILVKKNQQLLFEFMY